MCKKAGSWTNNLFDLAKRVQYGENGGQISTVRVLVEGPYGKCFPSIAVSFFIKKYVSFNPFPHVVSFPYI